MSIAAILLCTTLVTNVANTSVVTRECREVAPPIVMKAPAENKTVAFIQPSLATINETVVDRSAEKAETELQPVNSVSLQAMLPVDDSLSPTVFPKPVTAKAAKPKRFKAAKQFQNRKLRKAQRRAVEIREANRIENPAVQHRQPKKLTPWEKLQGIMIGRPKT